MKHIAACVSSFVVITALGCGGETNPFHQPVTENAPLGRAERALSASGAITWQGNSGKCIDVRAASTANGTPVQLYDCNGTNAQAWTYTNGTLQVLGNKCLDVTNGNTANGTQLQIWDCTTGNKNQQWVLNGSALQWQGTNMCIDLTGGNQTNSTLLQIWQCVGNNNQQWQTNFGGGTTTPPTTTPPSSSLVVAPYFFTWGYQNSAYQVTSLTNAKQKAGMNAATLAFEISGGGCNASSDAANMASDLQSFVNAGGRLIVSFGGADGPYLESTCSSASSIANAIEGVMSLTGTHNLDFDVEGSPLNDSGAISRRIQALQILQSKHSDLYVSYTLPVDAQGGLPSSAVSMLQQTVNAGVQVNIVNIMTMDYGYTLPNTSQGQMAVMAAKATVRQLAQVWPGASQATLYGRLGITPMIGKNDDNSVFTLTDAATVASFAKQNGVGLIAYWAMQRDQAGSGNYNDYSQAQSTNFAFLNAFKAAQ